jgi:hypothetical protein
MHRSLVASAVLCLCLAACSSSTGKGVTVSASTRTTAGTAPPKATATSLDGGNGIVITQVQIVVRKFEVEGQPACKTAPASGTPTTPPTGTGGMGATPADDHGGSGGSGGSDDGSGDGAGSDDGECEIESGPFLVDLSGDALTGGVHAVAGVDVPAGTYEELRFQIAPITAAQAGTDPGLGAMATAGASILVNGTDGTTPFQFKSTISVSQKREGAIVVDSTGTNVTLDFDPSGWFKAADGSKLDPTAAASASAIEANIRASVRVVHDDDHDGEDDDHGGGGGDGSGHDLSEAR